MPGLRRLTGRRIWVCGHRGMVGSVIVRRLEEAGAQVLVTPRDAVDLRRQEAVERFVHDHRPEEIVLAAATVGGIAANLARPVEFLQDNLLIAANVMAAAHRHDVERLLYVASSAVYPRDAPQPSGEDALLTGPLEPTHEGYAIAKIAGIKLAQSYHRQYGRAYFSVLPTNLYGRGDNFDPQTSHVIPALIRKAHTAKREGNDHITIWGSGQARREFLHADDCAGACIHLLRSNVDAPMFNLGSGEELTILELTQLVCRVVGFTGEIRTDPSKPSGPDRKLLDCSRLRATGWAPQVSLADGLASTYASFLERSAGNS